MKKKFFIILALLFMTTNAFSQDVDIYTCAYFDGYWSEWNNIGLGGKIKGNYDGFIIYLDSEGPWEYRFKFTIDNMAFPNKKQRNKDIKNGNYYVFSGTVEYYISDDEPSALENFRKKRGPYFVPAKLPNGRPTKKITSKATIKIAPFKNLPETYNIHFDKVGFGINLNGRYFPGLKFE